MAPAGGWRTKHRSTESSTPSRQVPAADTQFSSNINVKSFHGTILPLRWLVSLPLATMAPSEVADRISLTQNNKFQFQFILYISFCCFGLLRGTNPDFTFHVIAAVWHPSLLLWLWLWLFSSRSRSRSLTLPPHPVLCLLVG